MERNPMDTRALQPPQTHPWAGGPCSPLVHPKQLLAASLPGAAVEGTAEEPVVGSHGTAVTWNDQPIPSSLPVSNEPFPGFFGKD